MYKEEALQFLMTFEYRKRYLAGPRLASELEGTARMAIRTMTLRDPQWISHPRGVYTLLEKLESVVSKPSLVEGSRYIMKFFYNLQRKKQETMTSWIARHSEALWEASQALRKIQKEFSSKKTGWEASSWATGSSRGGAGWGAESRQGDHDSANPFRDDGRMDEDDNEEEDEDVQEYDGYSGWWHDRGGNHRTDSHKGSWSHWSSQGSWWSADYEVPPEWDTSDEIFIPEFLAGFLLLNRSGLDAHERANILAAIRGKFGTEAVGKALREQWSDEDLIRRDRQRANTAMAVEEIDEEMDALFADGGLDPGEGLTEEEMEAFTAEQERVEHAMEAIRQQKATLKEARWKQKQIKLGRGYFPPKPFPKAGGFKSGEKGKCFRCGSTEHQIKDCPKKAPMAKVAEETAEIVFSAEEVYASAEAMSAEEVIRSCQGIIDSGATASLGSVDALAQIQQHNIEALGDDQMQVDVDQRPVFKFGNGQKQGCISTVNLGIGAGPLKGSMQIHAHEVPNQPVLVSRKALKALGAIIDFRNNSVIYTKIDPHCVVQLREADNGHLLMPLVGNILDGGERRQTAFTSLSHE